MNGHQGQLIRLVALLGSLSLARACAYQQMQMENPSDWVYRHCAVGCIDMQPTEQNYQSCCQPLLNGATAPATCSELASSVAAKSTTCVWQPVRTTDSTGYSAPTSYSTACAASSAQTTAMPTTSGIEGQSFSSSAVTVWTTTTVPAPCDATAAPTSSQPANTNTCECTDAATDYAPSTSLADYSASSSTSAPETSDIQGSAYTSQPSSTSSASYATDSGVYAGAAPPADISGLDRRTEKQYTCACAAPSSSSSSSSSYVPPDTSEIQGESYTSSSTSSSSSSSWVEPTSTSSSASLYDYTTMPYATDSGVMAGDAPPAGTEIVDNAKRFLPTIYGSGPEATESVVKRLHPPVTDGGLMPIKRTYDDASSSASGGSGQQTVTSTTTVTGACSATDGSASSSNTASDSGVTAGATASGPVTENADGLRKRARRRY